jgi:MFS family permease
MVLCASVIARSTIETPVPEGRISRLHIRPIINRRRVFQLAQGLLDSITVVPGLLVLSVFGNEGILGTTVAISSVVSIVATYIYGRYAKQKDENRTLVISSIFFTFCSLLLVMLPTTAGIITYVLFSGIGVTFFTIANASKLLSLSEKEIGSATGGAYSFIFDNELFLNAGRIIGGGLLIATVVYGSESFGLFYGQLFVVAAHCLALILFFVLRRGSQKDDSLHQNSDILTPLASGQQ